MESKSNNNTDRRSFLGSLATGAVAIGLAPTATAGGNAQELISQEGSPLDAWFNSIKGKHRMVFDAVTANDGFSVIWSYTFMTTHNQTATADNDLTAMIVLRSKAIPLAFEDKIWSKFKLGKMFKIVDYDTNASAERNLYWSPKSGEMPEEGMSIKALMERGAKFCVCETAINMTARTYAKGKGLDTEEVKKEWIAGIHSGIQVVPSGVWAINRAQENGCSYCSAG
jgi:intracellular sulfur oxidation DsrE/DsrF family protein